ncbi:MAG: hypothetical protein J6U23_07645 [Clostridiales bacterium]|nr:hypothetical protein [Clostridiales bacterium]
MNDIRQTLKNRIDNLDRLISAKSQGMDKTLKGWIKIDKSHGHKHYYLFTSDGTKKSLTEREARLYAQKTYDNRVVRKAVIERNYLQSTLDSFPNECVEDVINAYTVDRRNLVNPIRQPDSDYAEKWLSLTFNQKPCSADGPVYKTQKGDMVKSKSELIIADRLYNLGIPYRYEAELRLGTEIIHPDFTILDVKRRREVYLEHLGKMDDPKYASDNVKRINLYGSHNILVGDKLFLTMETKDHPLNVENLNKVLAQFVFE